MSNAHLDDAYAAANAEADAGCCDDRCLVGGRGGNLLRRRAGNEIETELVCGDLTMDLLLRRVSRAGAAIDLLPRGVQAAGIFSPA